MMTYERLLLSFSGRIGRGYFWMGTLTVFLIEMNYLLLMGFILELDIVDFYNETRAAQLVLLSGFLLILIPSLSVSIKRLHDRGISGWWSGLLHLLIFQVHLQPFYGRLLEPGSAEWVVLNLPLFASGILTLWLYIEMGFRQGERKKNRYGNDPAHDLRTLANG